MLGQVEKTGVRDRFDDEYQEMIRQKNKAYQIMSQRNSRSTAEEYMKKEQRSGCTENYFLHYFSFQ